MRRLFSFAVLIATLVVPALAQVRVGAAGGRSVGGAVAARPMGPVRVGPMTSMGARPMRGFSGPVIRRRSGPTFVTSNPFVFNQACDPFVFQCSPPFISLQNGFHNRRFRFGHFRSFGFSSFGVSPFWGYSYPIFSDYQEPVQQQPVANPPVIIYTQPPPGTAQTDEEPPARTEARSLPPAKPAEPEPAEPVILIFRDHTRQEVSNYAIAGDTLYVFQEHGRRKIPLSDLDVPATVKVNDDRGVDFRVPAHKGS